MKKGSYELGKDMFDTLVFCVFICITVHFPQPEQNLKIDMLQLVVFEMAWG